MLTEVDEMAERKLSAEAQMFIVRAVAQFETPTAIVEQVRRHFAVSISRQNVERYHPHRAAGRSLSPHLREEFDRTRSSFIERVADVGISHRVVRLRNLERLA